MLDGTQPSRCYRHLLFSRVLTALHPLSFSMLTKYTLSWNVSPATQPNKSDGHVWLRIITSVILLEAPCSLADLAFITEQTTLTITLQVSLSPHFLKRASPLRTVMLISCESPAHFEQSYTPDHFDLRYTSLNAKVT